MGEGAEAWRGAFRTYQSFGKVRRIGKGGRRKKAGMVPNLEAPGCKRTITQVGKIEQKHFKGSKLE